MSELKHIKNFATFSQALSAQNETKRLQEKTSAQKEYADFFLKLLQKYDVNSPNDLDDSKKKEFFDELSKGWDSNDGNVTDSGQKSIDESLSTVEEDLIPIAAAFPIEERNGFLGAYHNAKKESKTSFEFKGKMYEIKNKNTSSKIVNESEIKSDDEFKEYAQEILKKAHGDKYNEAKAKDTINGILAKKGDSSYGELVGILQNSLA